MKKISTFFALCLFGHTLAAQTVRRVNGDPAITGVNVYNTIQAVVDAANTDDIILIEPFGENLGLNPFYVEDVFIGKRLKIYGNGYNLENPNLAVEPLDRRVVHFQGSIYFEEGSSGSIVKYLNGMPHADVYPNNIFYNGSLGIKESSITVESCRLTGIFMLSEETSTELISQGVNCQIRKSMLGILRDDRGILSRNASSLNLTVQNSMLYGNYYGNEALANIDNSIIKNCLVGNIYGTDNSVFTNCIFFQEVNCPNCYNFNNSISYSLSFQNDLPTANNNVNNVTWEQVFKGPSYGYKGYQGEDDVELSISSIAKNAGINGGDIGIYGGTYPYEKSGLPHHPISTFFINSGIGNNNIDVDAVITIKAN